MTPCNGSLWGAQCFEKERKCSRWNMRQFDKTADLRFVMMGPWSEVPRVVCQYAELRLAAELLYGLEV